MPHSIRAFAIVGMLLAGALASRRTMAQETITFPRDTKFVLQLNLQSLQDTEFGHWLFDVVRQKITEELSQQGKNGEGPSLEKINDILGFDPFEEVQQITLAADDYEHPERSMCAIVQMKETTGNLEGLMLALPDYQVDDYRNHRVHSALKDHGHDMKVFAVIHDSHSHGKRLVISPNRSSVEMVIDQMDGRSRSRREGGRGLAGDAILNLQVVDIPAEMLDDGPPANIARILKQLTLQVRDAEDDLEVVISIAAQNAEQTEQLRQMTQGLLAVLELARSIETDDENLQTVMELVDGLESRQDGDAMEVALRVNSDKLIELIEKEMD